MIPLIIFLLVCSCAHYSKSIASVSTSTYDHSITIYVPGTCMIRNLLENSFLRPLIYCPQGLSLAKNLPKNYHFYKMAESFVQLDPVRYSLDQIYLFGWKSEYVRHAVRHQAAYDLVKALHDLIIHYYDQHHCMPKVRLIGFSHGGNVILNLASYLPLVVNNQSISLEVWLFGTPVQQINKSFVNCPYFSKVYSFYSSKDWLQRLDPQGLYTLPINFHKFWSDRTFDLADRCIQVQFHVQHQAISHMDYRSLFSYFPYIQTLVEEKTQEANNQHIVLNLLL